MSFLKKFNRQRSVDLEEEARKKDEKEKAKELKRSKRHSVHVSARRDKPEDGAGEMASKDDSIVDDRAMQRKKEAQLREREKKKFKDMSGMVMTSPNEYPVFIVHYLGRMPADAEYGREAIEDPVHQLCKLREKQKLPKTLLAFNVDGMMCREVSGPFYKPKKEGLTFFIPLHHITYGVASLTHPQVFAIINKMTDDPSPANQVLVLHAFLCDKAEDAQALTYWQLQAYIEAFEDLKRKRMLKQRRKAAMEKEHPDGSASGGQRRGPPAPQSGANASAGNAPPALPPPKTNGASADPDPVYSTVVSPTPEEPPPSPQAKAQPSKPPQSPTGAKNAVVKPKRTNSVASTTSSSSTSSSSSTKMAPSPARKSSGESSDGIIQMPKKQQPGKIKSDAWPPKRGPPAQLRGPPPFSPAPPPGMSQSRTNSRDSAYGEGEDEFAITIAPTSPTSPSSPSSSQSAATTGSVFPGIAPRKSSESDTNKTASFESRISELQNLVEMDAEKLKELMINEYPTLSRKIYYKMSIDQNGVVTRKETAEDDQGTTTTAAAVNDDHSVA